MANYELGADEVILYEGTVTSKNYKGNLKLTLTSKKIVLEHEKGFIKKELEVVDILLLESIKFYNGEAQIKQKGNALELQTTQENLSLSFAGMLEAKKFFSKIIDVVTGTTLAKRGSDKVKGAFELIDDTLGFDTRETLKGFLEKGVKGAIFTGIGKKKE